VFEKVKKIKFIFLFNVTMFKLSDDMSLILCYDMSTYVFTN